MKTGQKRERKPNEYLTSYERKSGRASSFMLLKTLVYMYIQWSKNGRSLVHGGGKMGGA